SECRARPESARRSLRPEELFADFFERKNGIRPSPEMLALFNQVYEDAHAPETDARAVKVAAGGLRGGRSRSRARGLPRSARRRSSTPPAPTPSRSPGPPGAARRRAP